VFLSDCNTASPVALRDTAGETDRWPDGYGVHVQRVRLQA
jgi:hypothetical protein